MHELVVRRAELRMTREAAEARAVDQRLRMFDAKADREGFCLEEHAAALEHAQRVARAVTEREHDVTAVQRLAVLEQARLRCWPLSISRSVTLLSKRTSPPSVDDLRAHLLDDAGEPERADVRLADEQDFLAARRRARTRASPCGRRTSDP